MKRKILSLMFAFSLIFAMATQTVSVAAATDNQQVTITKNLQAVDTFKSVPAYYRPGGSDGSDTTYSCAALVKRYYSKVYGVTPYNLLYNQTPIVSGGTFKKVTTPQVGDIVGYVRKNGASNHWAIVREVHSGYVILLEQNWKWTSGSKTYSYSRHKVATKGAPNANYNNAIYFRYSKATTQTSQSSVATTAKATTTTTATKKVTGPRSLTLSKSSVAVKTYYTTKLSGTIKNKRSGDKLTYTSSNKKIATVSSSGTIKGIKKGTTYVTVKIKGTNISKKCKVTVSTGPRFITLNASVVTFVKVKQFKLKSNIYNKKSGDKVKYKISNTKVATISSSGQLKKKKKGTAVVTAYVPGTSTKKTCKVIVK